MLVLSRSKREEIVIDHGRIVITVVDIRGNRVRLGVTAPTDIPVHRGEYYEELAREHLTQQKEMNRSVTND